MNKRQFLKQTLLTAAGGVITFDVFAEIMKSVENIDPELLAADDDFWTAIRGDYKLTPDYINLENGYYCIMPQPIMEKQIEHLRRVNIEGSYYMRKHLNEDRKKVRQALATLVNAEMDEVVVTRNATESLDLVIGGFPWENGDEAIMVQQDYGAMLNMFTLQERLKGISTKRLMMPNNPQSDEEVVQLYANAITDKTNLIMVCHMINITGHVLPVRKICDMAHEKGVDVMVDGAHSLAHVHTDIKELDCDYYGSSLHKWLSTPLGAGLLFVKKDKIAKLDPVFAEHGGPKDDNINRINHTGTKPVHVDLGILDAIEYFNTLGAERKEKRLRFLNTYWTSKVRKLENVILNTPEDPNRYCAIANVGIKDMKPGDLSNTLMDKYGIWTVPINRPGVAGCRITPNIYTTTKELDRLIEAITEISGNK